MGYPMAKQLRAKIPASSKLIVCDVVEEQVNKFLNEFGDNVTSVKDPIQIAKIAVAFTSILMGALLRSH